MMQEYTSSRISACVELLKTRSSEEAKVLRKKLQKLLYHDIINMYFFFSFIARFTEVYRDNIFI